MPGAYDTNNIFAKILRGEIPCHRIFEDGETLAFMDIMPRSEGHCLVIPKRPARNLLDADPASLAAVAATVQKVAQAAKKAFGASGVTIAQYNESAAGQVVFHLHFHIMPRFDDQKLAHHGGPVADNALLAAQAAKIRAAL